MAVEILAGNGIEKAFKALGIEAERTFNRHYAYNVWEMSDDNFKKLCAAPENWPNTWGWWRSADGSNMGDVNHEYTINGKKITAWDGEFKETLKSDCAYCIDYQAGWCEGIGEDRAKCIFERTYPDILTYFYDELGASVERSICGLAVELARQNNMTMAELFNKYMK